MRLQALYVVILAILLAMTLCGCLNTTSPDQSVATPAFNPPSGTYTSAQNVTITCATTNAVIRYTLDGSEPNENSTVYTVSLGVISPGQIKAKAFKDGKTPSQTAGAQYVIGTFSTNFEYVWGGTFNNGTSDVTVSGLLVDKYEITQADYQVVMGTNPAIGYGVGDDYPVYYVDWFDAILYCNTRSIQESIVPCFSYANFGTDPANWPSDWNSASENHLNISCNWNASGYRLLTESEWEFIARGGILSQGYTYSGGNDPALVGWTYHLTNHATHPVGQKQPNELGIYDMCGNVEEMCWDIYSTYPNQPQTDPHGANIGDWRIKRGGAWRYNPEYATVAYRSYGLALAKRDYIGFRVCRKI
jgi:formylglycine-generating enzyme required for sulfatase activity